MIKKCIIAVLIGHAATSAWFLFPTTEHIFIAGYPAHVTEQWFVKGFCDCILRLIYATVICVLIRHHYPKMAMFFYITFWYYFLNLGLFWFNYCQWRYPFYVMMGCLCIAAWKLWPRKGLRLVK